MKRSLTYLLCLIVCCNIVWLSSGCTKKDNSTRQLTVSVPPQKYLLERITGDKFTVNSLLEPGTNPETFEPTIDKIMALENSETYFMVGGIDFETTTGTRIKETFPNLPMIESSKGIEKITGTHGHHGHDQTVDPHIWVSAKNALIMARNMYDEVVKLDPENKEFYTARFNTLADELRQTDARLDSLTKLAPNKAFAVMHPSLSYFARDYGLTQLSVEQDGKEATPAQIKERIDRARKLQPAIFLALQESGSKEASAVASEMGLPLIEVHLNDVDWLTQLNIIADALAAERNN